MIAKQRDKVSASGDVTKADEFAARRTDILRRGVILIFTSDFVSALVKEARTAVVNRLTEMYRH